MSVELLQTLSTVAFAVAGILFVAGAALFFLLDIKRVIGDVSGKTAKKAIENIRKENELSGDKAYKPSAVNKARGKVTDKISQSGSVVENKSNLDVAVGTSQLTNSEILKTQPPVNTSNETTVLPFPDNQQNGDIGATTVLSNGVQADFEIGATTVLSSASSQKGFVQNETSILSVHPENIVIDFEIGFCASSEIIQ